MSGKHQRGFVAAGFAGADFKLVEADRVQPGRLQALNETARRFFAFEPAQKLFERGTRAFDLDEDALRRIVDPAGQRQFRGEPVDKRAEADALHRAAQGEFHAHARGTLGLALHNILLQPDRADACIFSRFIVDNFASFGEVQPEIAKWPE